MEEEENVVANNEWVPRKQTWYNNETFPLVPQLTIRPANYHNTSGFSFSWLFFKIWSLDAFQLECSFNIDTHWGIGFTFLLPYLRVVATIPCPMEFGIFIDKHLSRKPQVLKESQFYDND